ncbi:MAG: Ltp family lipoprotein [Peptococcus niger]
MKKLLIPTMLSFLLLILPACGSPPANESSSSASISSSSVSSYTPAESSDEETSSKSTSNIPREYKSALNSAKNYLSISGFSKAGLYDQLTSDAGDKFTPEAAQYAIDNLKVDWNKQALKCAENYQDMDMSPAEIYDQLVSSAGEQFTPEEAQYAIDNLSQ